MEEQSDSEKLLNKLIETDPNFRKKLINKLGVKDSNESYSNLAAAEQVLPLLNDMVKSGKSIDLMYEHFPHWKSGTIKLKLHSGLNYIVKHLDPKGIYANLKQNIIIQKKQDRISIVFRKNQQEINTTGIWKYVVVNNEDDLIVEQDKSIEPTQVITTEEEWKNGLDIIMAGLPEKRQQVLSGLTLTDEDKEYIRSYFQEKGGYTVICNSERIKIIRDIIEGIERIQIS